MTRILLRATTIAAMALAAALLPPAAAALEIYKWIDENGVVHYSESRPEKRAATPVEKLHIASSNSPAYDPEGYYWSILNQAERIGEEWAAIQEQKALEEAEARAAAAQARVEELERRLAAREAIEYAPARPFYGPFALFPKRRHGFFNRDLHSRFDREPHRPPHHDRDRRDPPDPAPRPGWTRPEAPAAPRDPGFSR